jgi:hypothetical protein
MNPIPWIEPCLAKKTTTMGVLTVMSHPRDKPCLWWFMGDGEKEKKSKS